jgi:hypothetical protein
MAFSYLLKIKLGPDYTGLDLRAELQNKNGTAVLFSDGAASKVTGFIEQGVGDYSLWTDQWPDESFPFTVMLYDVATDDLLTTADMNAADFLLDGSDTPSSGATPTSRNERWPSLPVDTWREIIGYHPFHFWQLANSDVPISSACNTLVHEYAWQDTQQLGRAEIRRAISLAETRLAEHLGYHVGRRFIQETLRYPVPGVQGHQFRHSVDGRGRWLAVQASEGYIRNVGVERYALLDEAAAVTYSDEDGDGVDDTAIITISTSLLNPDEIGAYFNVTDRLDGEEVSERWRIAPAKIQISNGIATIIIRKWLCVKPIRYEGFASGALNPDTAANFVTSVDVYRRWCDPNGLTVNDCQATLIWETEPYPAWAICCGSPSGVSNGSDPAAVAYGIARAQVRDARLGEIVVGYSVYNSNTQEWTAADWGICRQPDRVILRYEAGAPLIGVENTGSGLAKDGRWDETIARLATAEMTRKICACDVANQEFYRWQFDLARAAGANDEQYRIADSALNNPLGTKAGQVHAWKQIANLMLGRSITL